MPTHNSDTPNSDTSLGAKSSTSQNSDISQNSDVSQNSDTFFGLTKMSLLWVGTVVHT